LGAEVAGTALKTQVLQTVTYTDGKISSWVQEFDKSKLQAAREAQIMSLCKETCEAQAQLAMGVGEVNQEMLAEFGKKFASSFTPTFEMVVNPQTPGLQVTGTFSEVMEVVGPVWIGFKNVKIESKSFSVKGDNDVVVSQLWHQQFLKQRAPKVKPLDIVPAVRQGLRENLRRINFMKVQMLPLVWEGGIRIDPRQAYRAQYKGWRPQSDRVRTRAG